MSKILVDTNLFTERKGSILFQGLLETVIQKAIEDRIRKEIARCHKEGTNYFPWIQHELPRLITTSLCYSENEELLHENKRSMLLERIYNALYIERGKSKGTPMVLYFEILERYFLFERVQTTRKGKDTDRIEMVFYETIPEEPDECLQKIARDVFKSFGMFALVR